MRNFRRMSASNGGDFARTYSSEGIGKAGKEGTTQQEHFDRHGIITVVTAHQGVP